MQITLGPQYNVGEKPTVILYIYISVTCAKNRHKMGPPVRARYHGSCDCGRSLLTHALKPTHPWQQGRLFSGNGWSHSCGDVCCCNKSVVGLNGVGKDLFSSLKST